MDNIAENSSSRIIAKIPALAAGVWRLKIVTKLSSGTIPLKDARTILYPVDLTVL